MDATIQRTVRNSELNVSKENRPFLTYPARDMAQCILEEMDDSVNFIFNTHHMEQADTILHQSKEIQLRFLINCAALEVMSTEYAYALSLDNLLIDINLVPKIMIRDVKTSESIAFIDTYKALIGSVLLPKYTYGDYIYGGINNHKKSKFLSELISLETVDAISHRLIEEYHGLIRETAETKKLVRKSNVWFTRIAIPVLSIALGVMTFFAGQMFLFDIPFRDSVIAANTAYINTNFLAVQQALRPFDVSELSVETRYFLSRSYVSTEALTETQRANILVGLAQRTDPIIFDYWILLGRLYFDEAVDIALRLGDEELLLFAYLKQEAFIRQDMSMPGEERAALLADLENHIDRINRARDEAMGGY
ncbi:MAG: hypothetical protein FWE05_04350 [Defluviitaleaceae bacterium]|nr:hypothetical protein [Defluviitaleaceae bacterium]